MMQKNEILSFKVQSENPQFDVDLFKRSLIFSVFMLRNCQYTEHIILIFLKLLGYVSIAPSTESSFTVEIKSENPDFLKEQIETALIETLELLEKTNQAILFPGIEILERFLSVVKK